MLVLRLEIHPHGDSSRKRSLGEVAIHNVGSNALLGRYDCFLSNESGFRHPNTPTSDEIRAVVRVSGFARSLGAWALVAKAVRMLVQKEMRNA